jgi:integrase
MRVNPADAKKLLCGGESSSGTHLKSRNAVLRTLEKDINCRLVLATPTHKYMTIKQMIATCEVAADRFLPRCIISYLARRYISASTPPEVIARIEPTTVLLTLAPSAQRRQPASPLRKFTPKTAQETDEGPEFVALPIWAIEFFKKNAGVSLRAMRADLTWLSTHPDIPPVGRYLAEFGLLKAKHRGTTKRKVGTLHIYLNLLFRHIAPSFENLDPAEVGRDGADDLYEEIWNDFVHSSSGQSRSSQSRFAILLIGFHQFLKQRYQAKELEEFNPSILGAREIHANIVSLEEVAQFMSAIADSSSFEDEQIPQAQLVASLGLSTFRRSEAFGLAPDDVDCVSIKVRRNKFRGTKTRSSIRCVPTATMPGGEAQQLLALTAVRKANKEDSLFRCASGFQDDEPLFNELLRLLRKTCKDDSVRFHTLRHTAISILVLALLCSESSSLKELLPTCQATLDYVRRGPILRKAIYGSDQVHWCDLHAIAMLAGHSSAKATTLPVYTSTLWLAHGAILMDNLELAHGIHELTLASGREKSGYRWLEKSEDPLAKLVFEHLFKREIKETKTARQTQKAKEGSSGRVDKKLSHFALALDLAAILINEQVPTGRPGSTESDTELREELKAELRALINAPNEEE